jgi:acyl-ACP thioesterase
MPLSKENILTNTYTIRSYEVDAGGRLSIPAIFNLLQDAASNHAFKLGVAVSQLLANNYTWVLSRIALKMTAYPVWRDTIQIATWPSGIQRIFALRDFDIRHENRTIGSCVSAWIIIDAAHRKPIRPTSFVEQLNPLEKEHVLDHPLGKLPRFRGSEFEHRFRVRYSDLDINQHVNNVSYIEWVLENIQSIEKNQRCLAELEINFLGEAFLGDEVIAGCRAMDSQGTEYAHNIVRETDNRELIRARTIWN